MSVIGTTLGSYEVTGAIDAVQVGWSGRVAARQTTLGPTEPLQVAMHL